MTIANNKVYRLTSHIVHKQKSRIASERGMRIKKRFHMVLVEHGVGVGVASWTNPDPFR